MALKNIPACLVAAWAAWPGAAAAQLRIAVVGPMTGQYEALGRQMRAGAEQAVADLNAAGGVLGQQVALEVGDDGCDPQKAVAVANQMAARGVAMVDGHYCSGSSIPASKVYAAEGIVEISPASTNPGYTDQGGWNSFRICGRDDQQGEVAAAFLADRYRGGRIAVINDGSSYGRGLAEQTRRALNAAGVREAMFEGYTPGQADYAALIGRMKAAGITAIYLGGYYAEAAAIARQSKAAGLSAPIVGGDALVTEGFWRLSGEAGAGTMMTFPADPRRVPAAAAVVKRFQARKIDPEGYTLYTYAAVQIWAQAAARARSADGFKVAAALKAGKWDSVLGPVSFDGKGDIAGSGWVMYVWKAGAYQQM